jgi:hypothetical protein
MMIRQRRNEKINSNLVKEDFSNIPEIDIRHDAIKKAVVDYSFLEYVKPAFFCMLLIMPIYAVAISAIKHDWIMMIIDALLAPVGFVHGVLLFFWLY